MRVLLTLTLLLCACDKITPGALGEDASVAEVHTEVEQEAQERNKLGVERDMLEAKVQITKEQLVELQGQLEDAKTDKQIAAAKGRRDKAEQEHKSAEAELARFKRQQTER